MVRANCTSHETRTIGQLNHIDEDPSFFQQHKPPPPPGKEDQWELQFCRWWGWNWVKKKDQYQTRNQTNATPQKRPVVEKKVKKKHLVDLCNCLCFKKDNENASNLQNFYSTPSQTVVCDSYACHSVIQKKEDDSICRLEVQRRISRSGNKNNGCKENCTKCGPSQCWIKKMEEWSNSSAEHCCKSSSEDSVKFLNIKCQCQCRCCRCQPEEQKPNIPEKCDIETQTDHVNKKRERPPLNSCAQMSKKETKKKRKLIVTCHCCCCKCVENLDVHSTQTEKEKAAELEANNVSSLSPRRKCECGSCCCLNAHRTPEVQVYHGTTHYKENELTRKNWLRRNPLYSGHLDALEMILHNDKRFSKFGNPSKQYPWVQRTRSDVLDHVYSLKLDEEFSSPISGRKYNLSPIKLDNINENNCSNLPDPIEVKENIKKLKKIESEAKMNLESRLMLDAVCDAILYDDRGTDSPSSFLNEFNFLDDGEKIISNRNENIQTEDNGDNFIENKLSNICGHQNYCPGQIEVLINNLIAEDNLQIENNNQTCQIAYDENIDNNITSLDYFNSDYQIFSKILEPEVVKHSRNFKRSASPISTENVKKFRTTLQENSTNSLVRNVDELFNKIDEIACKTKENDEKIRRVMHSLPKTIDVIENNDLDLPREDCLCISNVLQDVVETSNEIVGLSRTTSSFNNSARDASNKNAIIEIRPISGNKHNITVNKENTSNKSQHSLKERSNELEEFTADCINCEIKDQSSGRGSDEIKECSSDCINNGIEDTENQVVVGNRKKSKNSKPSMIPVKQNDKINLNKKQ